MFQAFLIFWNTPRKKTPDFKKTNACWKTKKKYIYIIYLEPVNVLYFGGFSPSKNVRPNLPPIPSIPVLGPVGCVAPHMADPRVSHCAVSPGGGACEFIGSNGPNGPPWVNPSLRPGVLKGMVILKNHGYPVILRILGFFSSPFSRKIHHPWLLSSPNITGFWLCWWMRRSYEQGQLTRTQVH